MSKTHALFLALLVAALMAVSVPLMVALWKLLLAQIVGMGMFWYSTTLACVAAPFLYAIFRRMK